MHILRSHPTFLSLSKIKFGKSHVKLKSIKKWTELYNLKDKYHKSCNINKKYNEAQLQKETERIWKDKLICGKDDKNKNKNKW